MSVGIVQDTVLVVSIYGNENVLSGRAFGGDLDFGFDIGFSRADVVHFNDLFCWESQEGLVEFQ